MYWASNSMVDGRNFTSWQLRRQQIDGTSGDSLRRSSPTYYTKTNGAFGNFLAAWSGWRRYRRNGPPEESPASTAPGPPTGGSHQSFGAQLQRTRHPPEIKRRAEDDATWNQVGRRMASTAHFLWASLQPAGTTARLNAALRPPNPHGPRRRRPDHARMRQPRSSRRSQVAEDTLNGYWPQRAKPLRRLQVCSSRSSRYPFPSHPRNLRHRRKRKKWSLPSCTGINPEAAETNR